MGDSFMTVIAIFVATILMFIFPLLSVSERSDDISQLAAQTAVVEFVDKVSSTGKITAADYDSLINSLATTGNTYDVEIEARILDENPGKKVTWTSGDKIGENIYYAQYTSQIVDELAKNDGKGEYVLKEGDMISVSVRNTNQTLSQMLRNFFYTISGQDTYQVAAEHAKMVTVTGQESKV